MGVDGSGKSTLISKIKKDYSKKFKVIKYLHLKPYLYLFDKRTVIKNPHKKKLNSNFLSIIKLFFWLIEYKFFYLIYSKKENQCFQGLAQRKSPRVGFGELLGIFGRFLSEILHL